MGYADKSLLVPFLKLLREIWESDMPERAIEGDLVGPGVWAIGEGGRVELIL